jgi:molybdate transport system substrate-binding protein
VGVSASKMKIAQLPVLRYLGTSSRRRFSLLPICVVVFAVAIHGALHPRSTMPQPKLTVMTSGGFTAASRTLFPEFERKAGCNIFVVYGASMGSAPEAIPNRLERGEFAEVVILASDAMDQLIARRKVFGDSRVDLAESVIGMAVRAGASKPDISSVENLKRALINAKSIAYSDSASGVYLSTELFARLGIADKIKSRCKRIRGEMVGAVVARGDAEVGFQQMSELLPIQGIEIVGPLPAEVQKITVFSGGVTTEWQQPQIASQFLGFLASREAARAIESSGLRPVPEKAQ